MKGRSWEGDVNQFALICLSSNVLEKFRYLRIGEVYLRINFELIFFVTFDTNFSSFGRFRV